MHESYLASLLNVQLWYWEAHRTMNHMAHQSFGPIFFGSWTDQEYAYWNDHVWVPSLKNSRDLMILHQIFIVSTWLSVCESVLCLLVEPNSQVTSERQSGSASRCLHIPSCWKLLNFGRFTWLSSAAHDFHTIWSPPTSLCAKSRKKTDLKSWCATSKHIKTLHHEGIPGL